MSNGKMNYVQLIKYRVERMNFKLRGCCNSKWTKKNGIDMLMQLQMSKVSLVLEQSTWITIFSLITVPIISLC